MQTSRPCRPGTRRNLLQISSAEIVIDGVVDTRRTRPGAKLSQLVNAMSDILDPIRRRLLAGFPLASASLALGATAAEAAPAPVPVDSRQPLFDTTDHVATYYRLDLAVDAIELAPHADHIVIFSGDGNLCSLVENLQKKGVRVSVVSTVRS